MWWNDRIIILWGKTAYLYGQQCFLGIGILWLEFQSNLLANLMAILEVILKAYRVSSVLSCFCIFFLQCFVAFKWSLKNKYLSQEAWFQHWLRSKLSWMKLIVKNYIWSYIFFRKKYGNMYLIDLNSSHYVGFVVNCVFSFGNKTISTHEEVEPLHAGHTRMAH